MATSLQWVAPAGQLTDVQTPGSWSPNDLPAPGDALSITGSGDASLAVTGDELEGDTLSITEYPRVYLQLTNATANIDLDQSDYPYAGSLDIEAIGTDYVQLAVGAADEPVSLEAGGGALLIGSIQGHGGSIQVAGNWCNDGTTSIEGSYASLTTVDAGTAGSISGTGTIAFFGAQGTFADTVGAGQTISLASDSSVLVGASTFGGSLDFVDRTDNIFTWSLAVTSFTQAGNTLTFYNGGNKVGSVQLAAGSLPVNVYVQPQSSTSSAQLILTATGVAAPAGAYLLSSTTTLTWLGGGDDAATDMGDWSPTGVPEPGENLLINTGTINVVGDALAGDQLNANGAGPGSDPTINLTNGTLSMSDCSAIVNVTGDSILDLDAAGRSDGSITINDQSVLTGSIVVNGEVSVSGPGKLAASSISVTSEDFGSGLSIASDIIGSGTVYDAGTLILDGSVASGVTVALDGREANVEIANPGAFDGLIIDTTPASQAGNEEVDLGVKASSYSYANGILQLYADGALVDTLRLQTPYQVSVTSNDLLPGVMVWTGPAAIGGQRCRNIRHRAVRRWRPVIYPPAHRLHPAPSRHPSAHRAVRRRRRTQAFS